MTRTPRFLQKAFLAAAFLALLVACPTSDASLIEIQFTGLDITYDGTDISAVADDLTTAVVLAGGVPAGPAFTTDIAIDLLIPSVAGLPSSGIGTVSTTGDSLELDLPGGDFLDLGLSDVDVTIVNQSSVTFTFGGAEASIVAQSLPFGLIMGDPVTVSFSTQIDPSSVTEAGGFLTSFVANGTGEVEGALVPEPTTLVMAAGLAAFAIRRRR